MAYIYILSSLPKLYEYIKNILISNKSYFYIEYLNNGIIHYEEITPLNCIEKIKPMRERNMNFYISTKPIEIDKISTMMVYSHLLLKEKEDERLLQQLNL